MDLNYLCAELYLWIVYEWNEPANSPKRKSVCNLLWNINIRDEFKILSNADILKKICKIVRSTNQEFPEEIRNLILMYSL
jgi:hypothetical protein